MTATASTSLRRFPERIGQLVVAPRAAVARVEADGGGLGDALWLVVLGVVAFRLPELCRVLFAVAGSSSGELARLVGLFLDETKQAAWVVLPAAVIVTAAAGPRRDASRDLDLGAACYAPYFALRAIARLFDAVTGVPMLREAVVDVVSAVGALVVLAEAIRLARRRPPDGRAPEAPAPDRRALRAGGAVLLLSAAAFAANVVSIARHYQDLQPMRQGQPAPDFALPDIDHAETVTLAQLRGQVVLLDFWATWCSPCVAMLPVLDTTHSAWASRGVAFVGVNSDGGGATLDEIKSFLAAHHIPYPVVVDDGSVGALYKVEALPSLVVVGRDGRIRKTFVGYTSQGALDSALRDAVDAVN